MDRVKQTGEVFTPVDLVNDLLNQLPPGIWADAEKTWLEPAAGDGNMLVEMKRRLLEAGHDEKHILDNMLFSIELIDDNHWELQHRLGYLIDGQPNPKFWPDGENFAISKIHPLTQDLNDSNPYHEKLGLERDEVLHHRNHVCYSALEYDMSFGREQHAEEKEARRSALLNKDRVRKPKPLVAKEFKPPKEPKQPTDGAKGGGWQVKTEWLNTGMKVRCKTPFDGSYWECDHDALVASINESLKAKGKTLIGEPGPSEKQYGSSSGLRDMKLWTRVA